jgi:hypothetical protein
MQSICCRSATLVSASKPSACRWVRAAVSSSVLRAHSASLQPISPSASAICSPRPREPPVMSAIRPSSSNNALTPTICPCRWIMRRSPLVRAPAGHSQPTRMCPQCQPGSDAKKKKGASRALVPEAGVPLLDLRVLAQVLDERLHLLLLQPFANLRGHLFERRELRVAHIVETDHVPAELRLYR